MKYAFATGASRGVGKEVAKELASKDYFVFIAGRDLGALEQVKLEISINGGNAEIVALDLLSLESIKTVPNLIKEKTDHLDILANIAGMYHDDEKHFFGIPFEQYPDDAIIKNINAILVGHILLTKYLVQFMDKDSSIVNMSGSFDEGETGVISDFITKHGIEIFTKQLPIELKDKGIRVNALRPGFVYTENVKKFFPDVEPTEALEPMSVAKKFVEIALDNRLNGQIIEMKK
ncbi:SDR family oxidoreductase [Candidatus Nomurabacteria bacterium]|nr:SDR family oxidoreductase [Candidatus Nomurabacteria bacterium]MCB9827056.1 SDR family oxidoreductase [Candidatus Nomurabacteria bacterium]MCB9827902.1 SDR family oxidoreductase [Candidatus Nomurabacteria bacterium]